jgi:two-component system chemotaxis response regulator CheY
MKVLIVDDAKMMHFVLKDHLQSSGIDIEVDDAYNGEEAVTKCQAEHFDVVFMDIVMPGKSGLDALKEIVAMGKNTRVIMASSMGTKDNVMKALSIGAKGFIQKPFEKEKVIQHLKEA